MAQGSYKIWVTDAAGNPLNYPPATETDTPDPSRSDATDIYFGLPAALPQPPPKEQADLQLGIGKVLRAIQILFLSDGENATAAQKTKFRVYYVRLFRLAQLGLEGPGAVAGANSVATSALASVTANLIDDEAGQVKNKHLKVLGRASFLLSLPFATCYLILRCIAKSPDGWLFKSLDHVGVVPLALANFMLLWIGCFLGVWLSYGIRTTAFTLTDLTVTDADQLVPMIRLIFAGALTMILGILFVIPLIDVKIGIQPLTAVGTEPMLAFLVGCFCGISELLLPTAVAKRANDFIASVK